MTARFPPAAARGGLERAALPKDHIQRSFFTVLKNLERHRFPDLPFDERFEIRFAVVDVLIVDGDDDVFSSDADFFGHRAWRDSGNHQAMVDSDLSSEHLTHPVAKELNAEPRR